MKFSSLTQLAKGLLQTSVGISIALVAAPAFADNASISGAVSYTTPAGFSTSISAEKVAPTGYNYTGNVTVTITPGGTEGSPLGMTLGDGGLALNIVGSTPVANSIKESVITKLDGLDTATQKGLDSYTAILKAAAGANGLE